MAASNARSRRLCHTTHGEHGSATREVRAGQGRRRHEPADLVGPRPSPSARADHPMSQTQSPRVLPYPAEGCAGGGWPEPVGLWAATPCRCVRVAQREGCGQLARAHASAAMRDGRGSMARGGRRAAKPLTAGGWSVGFGAHRCWCGAIQQPFWEGERARSPSSERLRRDHKRARSFGGPRAWLRLSCAPP